MDSAPPLACAANTAASYEGTTTDSKKQNVVFASSLDSNFDSWACREMLGVVSWSERSYIRQTTNQNTFVPTPSLVPNIGFDPLKMIWSSQKIGPIISCFGSIWGLPNVIGPATGVSILPSYGVNPHFVKLPIFSEFMENSTKFMKNSGLTKWTQNLR